MIECAVILDQTASAAIVRTGTCGERFTPVCTFKMPLALIGYDAGVLRDLHTPRWKYDPEIDAPARARIVVDPTIWEEESILQYFRELTRKLGATSFGG